MSVPFLDLKRDSLKYRDQYLAAFTRVLESGGFSLGPEVEKFEKEFADFLGVKHVIGVNGGTWALYAAYMALGIGPGDEVLVPANTFIATAEAVVATGATPVYCDIDPQTCLIDLKTCERLITPHTKAIVPVHLYGRAVEMDKVLAWAQERRLFVVEDCAQAHGSMHQGRRVGSFGHAGCFSFYPTKNLGALGEGGVVATNDDELASRLRGVRCHGILKEKYYHDIYGTNLKMDALQAAFLSLKLQRLDQANARRREIANRYRAGLSGLPLTLPPDVGASHVYHHFVVETEQRDELQKFLSDKGIGNGIYYPVPIHVQKSMARFGGKVGDCPVAERNVKRILSLPMFAEMRDDEADEVIAAVKGFYL
jgi:dTDP-4-amino-4,6-dideoxygalactose transaminase